MSNIRVKEFYTEEQANNWLAETKHELVDTKYSVSSGTDAEGEAYMDVGILVVYKLVENEIQQK